MADKTAEDFREEAIAAWNERVAGRPVSELQKTDLLLGEMTRAIFRYLEAERTRVDANLDALVRRLDAIEKARR